MPAPPSESVRRHENAWRELSSISLALRGLKKELLKVQKEHKEAPLRRVETYSWLIDVVAPLNERGLDDIIEAFAVAPSPETTEVQVMLLSLEDHLRKVPTNFAYSLEEHLEKMLHLSEELCRIASGKPVKPRLPAA